MKATQKTCWYHPEFGDRDFEKVEEIPEGWYDTPDKFPKKLDDMNKEELEEYARQFGVELDRRKSKANMLKDFEEALNDNGSTPD